MAKILGILAGIIIIAIIISIFWNGLGLGMADGETNNETNNESSSSQPVADKKEDTTESQSKYESVYVISVVKNDYIYNNKTIELDELLRSFEESSENFLVEIIDDNASLKAYNQLTESLEAMKITYTETP